MTEQARFRGPGDVIHTPEIGSITFDLMVEDGGFTRINEDGTDYVEPQPQSGGQESEVQSPKLVDEQTVDLSKLNKAQLIAEAEKRGVTIVPDEMTRAQIIEAIEAAAGAGKE